MPRSKATRPTPDRCRWFDITCGMCLRPQGIQRSEDGKTFQITHFMVECRGVHRGCGWTERSGGK